MDSTPIAKLLELTDLWTKFSMETQPPFLPIFVVGASSWPLALVPRVLFCLFFFLLLLDLGPELQLNQQEACCLQPLYHLINQGFSNSAHTTFGARDPQCDVYPLHCRVFNSILCLLDAISSSLVPSS